MNRLAPALGLIGLFTLPALAATPLASQRATYALNLTRVRGHAVTGATGRLQFNVTTTCHAYTVAQRMTLLIRNENGVLSRTTSDYDTWENLQGTRFSFLYRETNGQTTKTVSQGTATMGPNGGSVVYTAPKPHIVKLPKGTLFPMEHTTAFLHAAAKGQSFFDPPLFDGTSVRGADHTFVAILQRRKPRRSKFHQLSKLASVAVDIGFFHRAAHDNGPDFRNQMRYYTNGVARDIRLDFGGFVMRGALQHLQLPPDECQQKPVSADQAEPSHTHG
ncbi:MAG TPA: DUF1849 family protein [Acidiphilium sp.]|nr:MAG: hypothetical protein B7Z67_05920 [Acidiphilium sp. 21-60-14]OYV91530.1 MAG: hypothetical protein B7Z57_04700 [Acidiphilium sp. 37-60-79]OZB39732.1 MAG: hypothetical protein B7X48_07850 [Acidiphilium sp. 34-60-192]HQT87150.1 DUF1849 family protein [Acidiphilium sp.]HQU23678.1 DUF1849 family protein [Acidiphilium sp.]